MSRHDNDFEMALAVLTVEHHVLSATDAIRLLSAARASESGLDQLLITKVGAATLLPLTAFELGYPYVDLFSTASGYTEDVALVQLCDGAMLRSGLTLPLRAADGTVVVAMANPRSNQDMVAYITSVMPGPVTLAIAPASQILARLVGMDSADYSGAEAPVAGAGSAGAAGAASSAPVLTSESPVVAWVNSTLNRAVVDGASDLHFKFEADGSLLVRFRVDGALRRQNVPLRGREAQIIGTLLSKCPTIDVVDKLRPQDGTFSFSSASGRRIDARVGMLPQAHGVTVVIRLLDPENINRKLEDMGFSDATLEQMRRVVSSPQGAVFVIGPTGSGKTTTLYGLLKELPALKLNILTAEDPIEYRIPYIGQTQIRGDLGEKSLTFGRVLRSMLRLDPDVILVGEVRDSETAEVAMHAALTGHMVLSTLHAKSALGTYSRLAELGVKPYLSAESLSLAVNQRLVRRVHDCAIMEAPNAGEVGFLRRHQLEVPALVPRVRADGCPGCDGAGYRGRLAVVEVLEPSQLLRSLIAEGRPQSEVVKAAQDEGYTSILSDSHRHVVAGRTTVSEMLRCLDTGEMT